MSNWLLVTSPENYEICAHRGKWGEGSRTKAAKIRRGDMAFLYVKRPAFKLGALVRFVTDAYQESVQLWPDGPYPYRYDIEVLSPPDELIDFRQFVDDLDVIKDKGHYGRSLQTSSREINQHDFDLLKKATGTSEGV